MEIIESTRDFSEDSQTKHVGKFDNIKCNRKIGVFVKVDNDGFIIDVNNDIHIKDFDGWIKIDEGEGYRFSHAQACYFDTPLIDEFGNLTHKL